MSIDDTCNQVWNEAETALWFYGCLYDDFSLGFSDAKSQRWRYFLCSLCENQTEIHRCSLSMCKPSTKKKTLTQIVCIINNKQNKYKSDVSVCRSTNNPCLLSLSSLICSLQQLPSVWCSAGLNVMLLDFQLSLHVLHSLYNLPVSVWWSSPSDLHCSSLQSVFLLIDRKPQNVCPCTSCFHCVVKVWKDFWMDQWGPRLPRNQRPQSHFYF